MPAAPTRLPVILRLVLAAFYFVAGALHITWPAPFVSITPDWVPFPFAVVMFTGFCEIAGAAGLLMLSFQRLAGVALALYAVAVFPANINHAMLDLALPLPIFGWRYHVFRFALQPVIIWASLFAAGVTRWPFQDRARS